MDADDLTARVRRPDALARGLAKELAAVPANTLTCLLYRERRGYLEGLHAALGGVKGARVTLATALRRLEGSAAPGHRRPRSAARWGLCGAGAPSPGRSRPPVRPAGVSAAGRSRC
jgi:hypothetical protein